VMLVDNFLGTRLGSGFGDSLDRRFRDLLGGGLDGWLYGRLALGRFPGSWKCGNGLSSGWQGVRHFQVEEIGDVILEDLVPGRPRMGQGDPLTQRATKLGLTVMPAEQASC